jgi:hypothetical protein
MIEDKAFTSLLKLYIDNADHVHMKEPEVYGTYTYNIRRRDYGDEVGNNDFVIAEITETGSDKFLIRMEVTLDHEGCCGSNMYVRDPEIIHANPDDPCQKRMGQMFLKKALMPFTQFVYYAVGIKG